LGELAKRHGLTSLIAPARPSWKERYPLVPIDRYAGWRRSDGLLSIRGCAFTNASAPA
jgi:hypothetical protein